MPLNCRKTAKQFFLKKRYNNKTISKKFATIILNIQKVKTAVK